MKSATRTAVTGLGIYAGLLGAQHGLFEIAQGDVAPADVMINAIGLPCRAARVWHACLPAMTLIPNFLVTGILAVVVGLLVAIWAAVFAQRKHGGLVLLLLSGAMLLVGGGFVPTFIGLVSGFAGTRLHAPSGRGRSGRFTGTLALLARLWPWTLIVLAAWFPGAWLLGHFFNDAMVSLGFALFFLFDLGLPLLTIFAARAHDLRGQIAGNSLG